MRWLKVFALCSLAIATGIVLARAASDLPPLEPRTHSTAFANTNDTRLGRAIRPRAAAHPGLSGVHPLPQALDAFAARTLLARAAERSIDVQYYIWHDDLTGTLLFDELRTAADRGVRVRVLLDDNNTAGMDRILAALDAHRNIEVRLFNPFVIRMPRLIGYLTDFSRLNRRMHNKSFTVDNQATIIGGRNIGDEYFGAGDGALFVDLDVLAAGPVVRQVSADFDRYWASASAYPAAKIVQPTHDASIIATRASSVRSNPSARQYLDAIRDLPFVTDLVAGRLPLEWIPVRMVSDDPTKGLARAARDELLFAKLRGVVGEPRQSLGLVSGYFVPTEAGTDAFVQMARRGVDVAILTNSLAATDVPIVHAGYAKWRKPLLQAGVRLYEIYAPVSSRAPRREVTGVGSTGSRLTGAGSALHAKTFSVDQARVFVGSFNFDPRSAHLNTELGFVIDSPVLAGRMRDAFAHAIPEATYEVRLSGNGELFWVERHSGREVHHTTEPGTTLWQRTLVAVLSLLPIDWLL